MATSIEDRQRIERLEELLESVRAGSGAVLGAMSNSYAINVNTVGGTLPHTQTGTGTGAVVLAGIALPVRYSGVFYVSLDVDVSTTAAVAVTMALVTDTAAAGAITSTGTATAVGVSGVGAGMAGTGFVLGGTTDAAGTAANGLLYNGAPWTTAPITQATRNQTTTAVSGSTVNFTAHGIMYNANTSVKAKFSTANTVGFGWTLADTGGSGDVWTIKSINFSVFELPIF